MRVRASAPIFLTLACATAAALLACNALLGNDDFPPDPPKPDATTPFDASSAPETSAETGAVPCLIDTRSDPANCGACGHSCRGGPCIDSNCQPLIVAPRQAHPVAVEIGGQNVYWVNFGALDGGSPNAVRACGIECSAVVDIAVGMAGPWPVLTRDTGWVYFGYSPGDFLNATVFSVEKIPIDGGTKQLAFFWREVVNAPYGANSVASDGRFQYVTDTFNPSVLRYAPGAGDYRNLSGPWRRPHAVRASNGSVVVLDWAVVKTPSDGGSATELANAGTTPNGLWLAGQYAFWTDRGTPESSYGDGRILRVGLAGGPITTLAVAQADPTALFADDRYVYWVNRGDGTLRYVPVGGGELRTLANGQARPNDVRASSEWVVWANEGSQQGNFEDGAIMKVARPE